MSAPSARNLTLEDGQAAARLCAVNLLAQLKAAAGGDLDSVKRCVQLGVFVNAVPGFAQHPEVANGASDLMLEVFGDAGRHARAAVGAGSPAAQCGRRSRSGVRAGVTNTDVIARIGGHGGRDRRRGVERLRQSRKAARSASLHPLRILRGAGRDPAAPRARTGWQPCIWSSSAAARVHGIMPLYLQESTAAANMCSTGAGPMRSSARAAIITPSFRPACRSRRRPGPRLLVAAGAPE